MINAQKAPGARSKVRGSRFEARGPRFKVRGSRYALSNYPSPYEITAEPLHLASPGHWFVAVTPNHKNRPG